MNDFNQDIVLDFIHLFSFIFDFFLFCFALFCQEF